MTQPVSAKPMYQKIRGRLERDTAGGRYPAGGKFPSEAALVQRFGASRITVGRAVRELQERGLLDRVAGSGAGWRGAGAAARVQRFGASRITVGRAVRELQERGLLDRVAGSGTFVRGAGQRPREGLLFGLGIPDLGENAIFG